MGFIAFLLFMASSFLLVNLFTFKKTNGVLALFLFFSALVVVNGNILSYFDILDKIAAWFGAGIVCFLILFVVCFLEKGENPLSGMSIMDPRSKLRELKDCFLKSDNFTRWLFFPMVGTLFIVSLLSLGVVVFSAPHSLDSMGYHLTRMAFYLQNGNLNSFGADYWAQEVHPKNATILLIFTYLTSAKNENLTQLVQWFSYWISMLSVYGITRKMGQSKKAGLVAGLASGLSIIWVLESTTTQNDLILTAFIGMAVYFLLVYFEQKRKIMLILSSISLSLAIGTKASALLAIIPVSFIFLLVVTCKESNWMAKLQKVGFYSGILVVSCLIFALPSGYLENIKLYGHPVGPEIVRSIHSFEGHATEIILEGGSINLLRYGLEFISLDGLHGDLVNKIQSVLRLIPSELLSLIGIDLMSEEYSRGIFLVNRTPRAHEDLSYWGILGFGLVWLVIWYTIFGKKQPVINKVFAWAFLLFFVLQAFAGPYDPWRGRYFSTGVIFAFPLLGIVANCNNRWFRAYTHIVILLACLSALGALFFRNKGEILVSSQGYNEIPLFQMDRLQQLTRNDTTYLEPLYFFEKTIPTDAIIATMLESGTLEYPLFGEKLTRKIFPINSFTGEIIPIPLEADYLLYSDGNYPCFNQDDVFLGRNLYLQVLNDDNRYCSDLHN